MFNELLYDFFMEINDWEVEMNLEGFIGQCAECKKSMTAGEAMTYILMMKETKYPLFRDSWFDRKAFKRRCVMRSACDEIVCRLMQTEEQQNYIVAMAEPMWNYIQRLISHNPDHSDLYAQNDGSEQAEADLGYLELLNGYLEIFRQMPGTDMDKTCWRMLESLLFHLEYDIRQHCHV